MARVGLPEKGFELFICAEASTRHSYICDSVQVKNCMNVSTVFDTIIEILLVHTHDV